MSLLGKLFSQEKMPVHVRCLQVKLTQSNAILRHIARKNNLAGATLQEQAIADMCADQV